MLGLAPTSGDAASDDAAADDATADDATADDASSVALSRGTELEWRNCGQFENRNLECAEVEVPVDYDQPDGETLLVSVRRILANPLEPYHGALLFNPGGPGGEGVDFALSLVQNDLFNQIAPGYDIIGFDPRGVASSGGTGCGIRPENLYPGAAQAGGAPVLGVADYVARYAAEGERCEQQWGPLFRKLGSNNVVRDMEEIRKALQQPVLNFLGVSYGTRLGALYAHAYPETTGRMVLDGSVHPQASIVRSMRAKLNQTVALHEWLLASCDSGELACPPDARVLFDQALANARQRGVDTAFVDAWSAALASMDGVQALVQLLAEQAADPSGEWLSTYFSANDSFEGDGSDVAFASVNCSDDDFEPPTLAELDSVRTEFLQQSPVFGQNFAQYAALCAGWPATRDPVPMPTALDAPPLLVIGGLMDSRTPYEWAQAMTEALGNATLLTSNHFGHGAITEGGSCVRFTIRAYLTSGSLPSSGSLCE